MTIPLAMKSNGKKYMWDGVIYATKDEGAQAQKAYEQDGFEVQMKAEEDHFLVYSRRVASEKTGG
jgi:hypothetical protein